MSLEENTWNRVSDIMESDKQIVLSPHTSFAIQNDFKKFVIDLSRYKFVGKLLSNKSSCLEIGCNDGFKTCIFKQFVNKIVAVDFDKKAINFAKKNYESENINFKYGNFLNMDKIGEFDAIVSMDVIEHISEKNEEIFFRNICQNLKKHAIVIIGTPNITADKYQSKLSKISHINMYSYDRLEQVFKKYFHNFFLFGSNDEIVHMGFYPMAHYLIAVGIDAKIN